ncbi:unnamed protein product [Spirodela intermedia]|uniref:G domain-containing protein n=1 Tax=Spirodela intermedia TaxID=51605 RepID=A0A7I8L1E2_SPIIN|nr:unnamed protein product [Spirodela intermedia]
MTGAICTYRQHLAATVKKAGSSRMGTWGGWFTPHSAAAARAILERVPLVDLTLEVRDARIPLSSAFQPLTQDSFSRRRIILLNKLDLADHAQTERWIDSFKEKNCICFGVNSHNKGSIRELINFVRARIKELKAGDSGHTATVMLVGIPNVGKSAIANAMHQIGRISAEEKGKLRHAIVSSTPGDTKDIRSYKIASHPNIYVLDTPGILFPEIADAHAASNLALTGAIKDSLVGECALAQYFLSVLNSNEEYKKWESLSGHAKENSAQKRGQYPSDHTQDFVVWDVRRTLFETISSFGRRCLEEEVEMGRLIELQFAALHEDFRIPADDTDGYRTVALKLLNLFRTGRLGRYTLDPIPQVSDDHSLIHPPNISPSDFPSQNI